METIKNRFFGRDRLLQEIVQGVLAPQPASFSLVGSKLLGKSQILNHLVSDMGPLHHPEMADWRPLRYQDTGRIVAIKFDCDWQEVQQDLLGYVYQNLAQQIRETEKIGLDWELIEVQTSHGRRLLQIARQLNQMDYRLVLLFDNFDSVFEQQLIPLETVDELRPLTLELALVVATEQPLHDLDRELAASPLFNVMTQLFVKLIEPEAAQNWIDAYTEVYPVVSELSAELLEITGAHPYLLHGMSDVLPEVQQMLPPDNPLSAEHFPLIRLRLEEHGRLLFVTLWRKLQNPPGRLQSEVVLAVITQMLTSPLSMKQIGREQFAIINWLINQAIVSYSSTGYQLFSPLFAEFLAARLPESQTATQPPQPIQHGSDAEVYQNLTKIETALLRYFEARPNTVIPAEQLLAEVWRRPDASTRRVQEAIRRLRLQIDKSSDAVGVIENDRGRGYRFVPAETIANGQVVIS